MPAPDRAQVYRRIKRAGDLTLALLGLLLTAPLQLALWCLIRVRMGGPVLFRQPRPGLGGRIFMLYKFRTMNSRLGSDGKLLPDAERLTALGKVIRQLSLDELPQLWNVVRGDMSLIGPRPLLVDYLSRYTPEQARRHEIRPGITGWAQVNGRNALDWERRFVFDVWYVDHYSFSVDLRILALTLKKVLLRSGVSTSGHATSPEFRGSALNEKP